MGWHVSWFAVRNTPIEAAAAAAGLRVEDEVEGGDPGFYGFETGGWTLILGDGRDYCADVRPGHAKSASAGTEALWFTADDTSMGTMLVAWRDGQQTWSIVYDGSDGVGAPVLAGPVPAIATEALARRQAQQAATDKGVDYLYEVTHDVAQALTGYRHDEVFLGEDVAPAYALSAA